MIRTTVRAAICALFATAVQAAPASLLPAHNWVTPASGQSRDLVAYYTGNDLYDLCKKDEFTCTVYVQGAIDGQLSAVMGTNRTVAYCIPGSSKPQQVKDVVVAFLAAHPEDRHLMAGGLIAAALANAWPKCS